MTASAVRQAERHHAYAVHLLVQATSEPAHRVARILDMAAEQLQFALQTAQRERPR